MTEQQYRERLHAFRSSCRVYKQEKEFLEKHANTAVQPDQRLVSYFKEDVESVEHIFSMLSELCGRPAALMVWMLCVEEKTQAAAAYQLNITRRQLQYSFSRYMHLVFEEERSRAAG